MIVEKRTSPWVWVAAGCLGALLLALGVVMTLGYLGYRKVKELEAEMKDPEARSASARRVLGAERLPEGYHAVIGMSVPLVMDMAMLSDRPPDAEGQSRGLGERGFIYVRTLAPNQNQQEMRDYFEGRSDDADVLRRNNIRIHREGAVLRRGVIDLAEDAKLMYMSQRGSMDMSHGSARGITTLMLLSCTGDSRQRMGIWFGPEPARTASPPAAERRRSSVVSEEIDLSGTPADESAIREFMAHFRLCGR
jgi:hypothetical protein